MKFTNKATFILLLILISFACTTEYTPKPKGYPRLDLVQPVYKTFESACPFSFEHNGISRVERAGNEDLNCWFNIVYPSLNCTIHLSYMNVDNNLNQLLEDSRSLVYKHAIKASAINQKEITDGENKIYAGIYEINGDAASSVQFYATDSLTHFLRGALYFNAASNSDSLKPAIDYVRKDVEVLLNSLKWTEKP